MINKINGKEKIGNAIFGESGAILNLLPPSISSVRSPSFISSGSTSHLFSFQKAFPQVLA